MYRESFRFLVHHRIAFFVVLALFLVLELISVRRWNDQIGVMTGISATVLFISLEFYVCFRVIFPDRSILLSDMAKIVGFLLLKLLLLVLIVLPAAGLLLLLFYLTDFEDELARQGKWLIESKYVPVILIYGVGLFVYSFLGTILPAHVAGRETGLLYAFWRGQRTFFRLLWRFLLGPGVIFVACQLAYYLNSINRFFPREFIDENWVLNVTTILIKIPLMGLDIWMTVLIAWILSTVFLKDEAEEEALYGQAAAS